MAVIKEYQCAAHGEFESTQMLCPHGCGTDMVERVFRTAPSIQGASFKRINQTFSEVARENRMSDLDQRGGDGMLRADWRARRRVDQAVAMMAYNGRRVDHLFADVQSRFRTSTTPTAASSIVSSSADSRPSGGGLYKDPKTGATMVGQGISLGPVQAPKGTPDFDGLALGTPGQ